MKSLALTAISAAVFAAASSETHAYFIDDSALDIKLRTVHFDINGNGRDDTWSQTAEGIELNYKSGYFADTIGFDASYYGVIALDHSGKNPYDIESEGGQLLSKDDSGFHKVGQGFVKLKTGDQSGRGIYTQIGYMNGKNGGLKGSDSRSIPSGYRGVLVEGYLMDGWMVHGDYFDRVSLQSETSWDYLTTKSKEKINYVWQLGSVYNSDNWRAEGFYLESEDYSKQFSGTLAYTFILNDDTTLMLEGMYYGLGENGKKWDKHGFDDKASQYTFTTELVYSGFTGTLIYGSTSAEKDGALGELFDGASYNSYGSSPSRVSYLVGSFKFDGEKVWQAEAGYDFGKMGWEGFNAKIGYIFGSDINDPTGKKMEKEKEMFAELSYFFSKSSPLKGLSFKVQKGWGKTEYQNKDTESENALRAYIDYTVNIF